MCCRPVIAYGLIPGLVAATLTALRSWLEIERPESAATKLISVFVLALVWLFVAAALMLRRGASLKSYVGVAAVFALVYRAAVAVPYALAWTQKWRTASGAPTRYETQIAEMAQGGMPITADSGFFAVWAPVTAFPTVVHIVFAVVAWFIVWAVAFRGKRPAVAAAN
jgi:hypothetical protein